MKSRNFRFILMRNLEIQCLFSRYLENSRLFLYKIGMEIQGLLPWNLEFWGLFPWKIWKFMASFNKIKKFEIYYGEKSGNKWLSPKNLYIWDSFSGKNWKFRVCFHVFEIYFHKKSGNSWLDSIKSGNFGSIISEKN